MRLRTLTELLGFEVKLHTRQVGFWIACLALTLFGLLASSTDFISISIESGSRIKNNGAIPLALNISVLSLLSIFFAAVFVVTGVMRDDTHKSLEIIHATPVTTPAMLLTRMIGVWVATTIAVLAGVVGLALGQFMPWTDADSFQAFNLWHYVQPSLLFILPNALLVAGIYAAIAAITRNRAIVYTSAVGLFALYFASGIIVGQNPPDALAAFSDPFGSGALATEVRFWPPAEQNGVTAPVAGWVGWNRLVYTLIGLAGFALAFVLATRGTPKRRSKRRVEAPAGQPPRRVAPLTPQLGSSHTLAAFWTRVRFEYLTTVRSTAFLILVGIAVALFGIVLWAQTSSLNPQPTLPTSSFMIDVALGSLAIPVIIVMVFFGSDIMWRDRTAGMFGILDATPVRDVSLLLAKWAALALIVLSLIAATLIVAMGVQLAIGGETILPVPRTYLAVGFVTFFLGFFFQGMLVMFIQNFMPGRVVGMLVAAAVLIGLMLFISRLPFYHPLMDFGGADAGQFSEMGGFSNPERLAWSLPYWLSFILILGALSILVWKRGTQVGLGHRLRSSRARLSLPVAVAGLGGTLAFAALAFVGYGSYAADDYRNTRAIERAQADLERAVADAVDLPVPKVREVRVDADISPSTRTAVIESRYRFDNPHAAPLERLAVYIPVGLDNLDRLDIAGATRIEDTPVAAALAAEDVLFMRFDPPLAPGASATLDYKGRFSAPTLAASSAIHRNGTFIDNGASLPSFGAIERGFLTDPDKRRKYDLPERELSPDRDAPGVRDTNFFGHYADYVDFSATLCTDPGQTPVAPGKLLREYENDGRACRDFEAINPIQFFFAFLSADYEVRRDVWTNPNGDDVDLAIYFHPEHDYNIDLMFAAMKQSFDTYTAQFGPYPYAQLRIMEFPYRSFAQAFAGTVPFSENIGFVLDPGNAGDPKRMDTASYVTLHEIGHQWFGHQIVPADAKGANVLSEGLTEYATGLAYEDMYGFAAARRVHEVRSVQQYLTGRTTDREPEAPLATVEEEKQYMVYNKAAWVFWGLRGILGDELVRRAVVDLLDTYGSKGPPYPTTQDLVDRLLVEAGPEHDQLVRDMWDRITFWNLEITDDITITPQGDRFDITVPVEIDKLYAAPETGEETSVTSEDYAGGGTLDEWVMIGFYTQDPTDTLGSEPYATEIVRVDDRETVLAFTLDTRPTHVLLDPHRYLIERDVANNVRAVSDADES